MVIFNSWKFGLSTNSVMYTGWLQGQTIVNVLNPQEQYILGEYGELASVGLNGYEIKVFVLQSALKPFAPVVTRAWPAHDVVIDSTQSTQKMSFDFSEPMDVTTFARALTFDGKPVSGASYNEVYRTLSFTVPTNQIADGIHYIQINQGAVSRKSLHMEYTFSVRFRKGGQDNVIINPAFTKDNAMVKGKKIEGPNKSLQLQHRALGAQLFRLSTDGWTNWSAWTPFVETSEVTVAKAWTGTVSVQYYADNSAAYYVESGTVN